MDCRWCSGMEVISYSGCAVSSLIVRLEEDIGQIVRSKYLSLWSGPGQTTLTNDQFPCSNVIYLIFASYFLFYADAGNVHIWFYTLQVPSGILGQSFMDFSLSICLLLNKMKRFKINNQTHEGGGSRYFNRDTLHT